MELLTNILTYLKCCRKFARNITTPEKLDVKRWVELCENCAKDKRVPKNAITPEMLNLPDWDLGQEGARQID